jgi:hypothetical protein
MNTSAHVTSKLTIFEVISQTFTGPISYSQALLALSVSISV